MPYKISLTTIPYMSFAPQHQMSLLRKRHKVTAVSPSGVILFSQMNRQRQKISFIARKILSFLGHVLGRLGCQDLCRIVDLCVHSSARLLQEEMGIQQQNCRPYHVLFYVGVLSRRHLHFSTLLTLFSLFSLLNRIGLGSNLYIGGYREYVCNGLFPFESFQHIDIMSHNALRIIR